MIEHARSELRKSYLNGPFAQNRRFSIGTCHFRLDRTGHPDLIHVSDRMLAILDLKRDELLRSPALAYERIHADDRASLYIAARSAARHPKPFEWQGRVLTRDVERKIRLEAQPSFSGTDRVVWDGVVSESRTDDDVASRLNLVLRAAKAHVWRMDLPADRSEFDLEWADVIGLPSGQRQIPHAEWMNAIHPDDAAQVNRTFLDLETGQINSAVLSYRRRIAEDRWIWLRTHAGVSERDAEGKVVALSGVSFDITEEVDVKARAKRETERLDAALSEARSELARTAYDLTENIPVGTYTMVLEPGAALAHFAFMSRKFLEITGLSREEAQSDPMTAFGCVHPEDFDAWVRKNERAFLSKERFREETRLLVDGKLSWVVAESIPRQLADGSWIWEGVIQDITAQKLAEQALQDTTLKLIENSRSKAAIEERQRMLRNIHDGFGNQLAVAKLRLRRGAGTVGEAEQILDDCLDDLQLLFESLDAQQDGLLSVLAALQERLERRTRLLPLSMHWDIEDAAGVQIEAGQLLQATRIVQEACANALRHAHARNITVNCDVSGDGARLVIADDGIGFASDAKSSGRGIANMHHRAREQNWRLEIRSDTSGTEVELFIR